MLRIWSLSAADFALGSGPRTLVAVSMVPKPGVLGLVIVALSMLFAARRCTSALFKNERYRFTTWRWGIPVMGLLAR